MQQETYSVYELNTYIRDLLEEDQRLQDIWVMGEISNMKAAASGHWYFTLKDDDSQLRCVMFRFATLRQTMIPEDGDAVLVHGKVSVYEVRGEYQLYADEIQPIGGTGNLYQQFEELKARLLAEGLFDVERKRSLPVFPLKIGVVTSPDAAAFRDIQNVLRRRFPLAEVILSPTLVQGADAPMQIVMALARLNEYTDADVILICRGGGSIEDLWAFNDERVARAISVSRIPTVSGVGHETDFTITDFVVDRRAPTPSAAAEIATPSIPGIQEYLMESYLRLQKVVEEKLERVQADMLTMTHAFRRSSPEKQIHHFQQRADDLAIRLSNAEKRILASLNEQLRGRSVALESANPVTIMSRGYAIVTHAENQSRITSAHDVKSHDVIQIAFQDGKVDARIEEEHD